MSASARVNFVYFTFGHHATHSGYDKLCRYFKARNPATRSIVAEPPPLLKAVPRRFIDPFVYHSGMSGYTRDSFMTECQVMPKILLGRGEIFHFAYGENSYRYSSLVPRLRGSKLVCTFHQPPELFDGFVRYTNHIRKLDAIVAVGSNQTEYFAQFVPKNSVFLVPHGVDTDFFRPLEEKPEPRSAETCLFVGNWLRDFDTLREVIAIVGQRRPDTRFLAVVLKQNLHYFAGMANVTLQSDIKDEELLWYYQNADLLVQPLKSCTANNAVLEGMACGLPIVVSDVGGIKDYVNQASSILVPPGNPEIMAHEILGLLQDQDRLRRMSASSRARALAFSWPRIAEQMEHVYQMAICSRFGSIGR
jgi:glycosyltransferase involved in cell wall biosynthesis